MADLLILSEVQESTGQVLELVVFVRQVHPSNFGQVSVSCFWPLSQLQLESFAKNLSTGATTDYEVTS